MPSQKTFRVKQKLAKAGRQNRPIPQWFRLKTDTKIQLLHLLRFKNQCCSPIISNSIIYNAQISGNFTGAHNLMFVDSVFVDGMAQEAEARVMQRLRGYSMLGAELTSGTRDPPPRCYAKTRITIFDKIRTWFESKRADQRKRTAANTRSGFILLSSRTKSPRDTDHSLAAYQIAVWNKAYRAYLVERLSIDPHLPETNIIEQFRAFITIPIVKRRVFDANKEFFIILDGLEQCKGREAGSLNRRVSMPREDVQSRILTLIAEFVAEHPAAPVTWVISSRSEEHLKVAFSNLNVSYWHLHIPIDDDEARRDVRLYLNEGFRSIYERFKSRFDSSNWPTERDFEKVAHAASGLFAFGEDILQFTGDRTIGNPVPQLEIVLSAIDGLPPTSLERNPFGCLDAFYTQIATPAHHSALPAMHRLLGHMLLREQFFAELSLFGYSLYAASNILGIPQHTVYSALSHLHSVLDIPSPSIAHTRSIQFLHSSFSNYLKDGQRSGNLVIDFTSVNTYIWKRYSQIIEQALNNQNPVITMTWPLPKTSSREDTKAFSLGLLYEAQFHWAHFLIPDCPCADFSSSGPSGTISLGARERLDALETVRFDKLVAGYFTEDSDHFGPFFKFICDLWQSSPKELERRGLMKETYLLDVSMDAINTEMLETEDQAICIEEQLGGQTSLWRTHELEMDMLIEEARSLKRDQPGTRVLVCGKETGRGALIIYDKSGQSRVYYYVPLR
ncbi:hypothetical protein D9756_010414 [Leucocoprinus leucothites]|uniref:Large ribosomal subunit protein eL39 n=1 Tax=Leucocoprinus leucothites TaxID=201217 RepID=A0A8H5FRT4_9AGAR|nr:hypothetical protein D9756_010414 [Leucoagaricus leucothites]